MSLERDPIFDALAGLPPVTPDTKWEARIQARCRSAMSESVAVRRRRKRYLSGLALISEVVVLCTYLVTMCAQAVQLAAHS